MATISAQVGVGGLSGAASSISTLLEPMLLKHTKTFFSLITEAAIYSVRVPYPKTLAKALCSILTHLGCP
jgi:hypothetical protein